MSRNTTRLLAALAVVSGLIGAARAQTPTQDGAPELAAEVKPQHGGPHRDPPGAQTKIRCPQGWSRVSPGVNPALRCLPDHLVAPSSGPVRIAAPPPGCPGGWRAVAPELNPVLRCQPVNLVLVQPGGKGPKPPVGCPAGWRPVAPNVNPILRCLPDQIAATPPPGTDQAAPPPGCPTGWKPVPPNINPLMRCLPDRITASTGTQPQRVGPDPGEPAQATLGVGRPDLALVGGFLIGDATLAWGTSSRLSADQAAFKKGGRCGFRYRYSTRNQGGMPAGATSNRILLDAQDGPVLATAALPVLAPGAAANSSGHVLLAPGTWTLYVHADAPMAVVEGDEANNLRRVRVTVQGDC